MVQMSYTWFQTQVHGDRAPYTLRVDKVHDDGVQDTLSQNMVPRHIGYFKLKEFEKRGGLWSLPSPWRPPTLRKVTSLSLQMERHAERNLNGQALLGFPQFTHTLCPIVLSHDFPLFIKPNIKTPRFNPFLGVFISLWRFPCDVKLILNKCVCFPLVNLSVVTEPQSRT